MSVLEEIIYESRNLDKEIIEEYSIPRLACMELEDVHQEYYKIKSGFEDIQKIYANFLNLKNFLGIKEKHKKELGNLGGKLLRLSYAPVILQPIKSPDFIDLEWKSRKAHISSFRSDIFILKNKISVYKDR